MPTTLQMAPMQWAGLKDIDDVEPLNSGDYDCLAEVREVLKKHGKRERFGIALLHKHFDLAADEQLMEVSDEQERVLTIKPVKQGEAGKSVETVWMLLDGAHQPMMGCQMRCSWIRDERHKRKHECTTCFPAGTMVLVGDNTEKSIQEVLIGEFVMTPFGPARVKDLDRPLLGNRPLYEMQHGRKLRASAEHSIWGRNPETRVEWWTTRDIDLWRREAEMGVGSAYSPDPVDLKDQEGVEWEFATVEGWNKTAWRRVEASEDLQLYDLVLESGGAYFADGYMVKALYDAPTEDWKQYKHRPIAADVTRSRADRAVRARPALAALGQ
jgi:hypothetical protein